MRAFVMAAGVGTRLRPLTYAVPKPMLSVVDKPVLEHTLELLKKYGIIDIVINLHYQADMIRDYFDDGSPWGMKITYSFEEQLMGTAGGVKKTEDFFDDTFLVMSGDGLTDVNIENVVEFHKGKKALATIVVKKVDARFDYGVVLADENGYVAKFLEKPSWGDIFANTVNTGIYVFEPEIFKYIPKDKPFDFGHNLFPFLLENNELISVYETKDYWCDIGNLHEYKRAQYDVLQRKVKVNIPGKNIGEDIWVGANSHISPDVTFKGPVIIGKNTRIEKDVDIGEFTIIGDNGLVCSGAKLTNCIVWDNVYIDKNVHLNNCIIGNHAHIQENISVFEGSVININKSN